MRCICDVSRVLLFIKSHLRLCFPEKCFFLFCRDLCHCPRHLGINRREHNFPFGTKHKLVAGFMHHIVCKGGNYRRTRAERPFPLKVLGEHGFVHSGHFGRCHTAQSDGFHLLSNMPPRLELRQKHFRNPIQ